MSPEEISIVVQKITDGVLEGLKAQSNDGLLDVHGAANFLNCSVATVERMTRRGELPSIKFGKLRRYDKAQIHAAGTREGLPRIFRGI